MQSLPVEKASIRRKAHGAPSLGTCGRKIGKHQKRLSDRLLQTLRQRYNENIRRKRFPPSSAFSPTRKNGAAGILFRQRRAHTGETSYGNAPVPSLKFARHAAKPYGAFAGSTTASRGTFQLGHAVVNAARQLRGDLNKYGGRLDRLVGRFYKGHYDSAGQTSGQGAPGEIRNHVSYSFATHVVFMDEEGGIEKIIAAHDSGRVVNRPLYEGQVQGGVVMGMGYALTESIPVKGGYLTSGKLNACGLLRSVDVPEIEVIAVEVPDPEGPCGAKGIGEIACIPTAPAIVNALYLVDGVRRRELPVRKKR